LEFSEKNILHEIVRKNENEQWGIGAILLLNEKEEAIKRIELLQPEEQAQLKAFLIGKFMIDNT